VAASDRHPGANTFKVATDGLLARPLRSIDDSGTVLHVPHSRRASPTPAS
jgi:hypothetical protein